MWPRGPQVMVPLDGIQCSCCGSPKVRLAGATATNVSRLSDPSGSEGRKNLNGAIKRDFRNSLI